MNKKHIAFIAIALIVILGSVNAFAGIATSKRQLVFDVAACAGYYDAFANKAAHEGRYDLFQEWDDRQAKMSDAMLSLMHSNHLEYNQVVEYSLQTRDSFREGAATPEDAFKMATTCPEYTNFIIRGDLEESFKALPDE